MASAIGATARRNIPLSNPAFSTPRTLAKTFAERQPNGLAKAIGKQLLSSPIHAILNPVSP
jgi:hypothetical protein